MPPVRKVEKLPPEFRRWLHEELTARGFGEYETLADALNWRLEDAGLDLRIQKSALADYGSEYKEFAKLQEEAGAWTKTWMTDAGLDSEAESHKILFQMINALAFKHMKGLLEEGVEVEAKNLHFIGKMLKDVMASSGIREKLVADAAERAAKEARERAAGDAEKAAKSAGLTAEKAAAIRNAVLGVAA
ncbi:MAG: phage protein Gp27 family protein [Pseudomonadota bacterium]